tara:strand:+ start:964 stop:1989 length:1026 start_codon:yes stop_codon:yes gene_type:complete
MANVFLRSPYYVAKDMGVTGGLSIKLKLTVAGSLAYTIIKNRVNSDVLNFEISELIRDYLDIGYNGTPISSDFSTVTSYSLEVYSGQDATGTLISTDTSSFFTIDAYGYFKEGSNPTTTKGYMQSNDVIYNLNNQGIRLPIDRNNATEWDAYENGVIFESGTFTTSATEVFDYITVSENADELRITTTDGVKIIKIITVDECRFNPYKITFVNKLGGLQDMYFFKKSKESLSIKKESYKSNIISEYGIYDSTNHSSKDFNVIGNESISLSSGYLSEDYNEVFKQLLLSDKVWMTEITGLTDVIIPINVKESSLNYKTSVNDKLVDYTIKFDKAFDTINNIR